MILLLLAAAVAQEAQAPTPAEPIGAFAAETRLDLETLHDETARADTKQAATANQAAGVSQNSVVGNSATGGITLDGQSFQNMSGMTIVNANSGNNVAINSSLNVNIRFTPGQ